MPQACPRSFTHFLGYIFIMEMDHEWRATTGPVLPEDAAAVDGKRDMITHTVQFARQSVDEIERRGTIESEGALHLFRTFPFADELALRKRDPKLTAPTIEFKDESSGSCLVVWSESAGKFELWVPSELASARDVVDTIAIERCIGLFFQGQIQELADCVTKLDSGGPPYPILTP